MMRISMSAPPLSQRIDPDLRLQPDASGRSVHRLLDLADQLLHVGAGGAAHG